MKTRQGFEYYVEDGKFVYGDCYDQYDSLEELEAAIDWDIKWANNEAHKDVETGEWKLTEYGKSVARLMNLLEDLFGKPLTHEEWNFHDDVLYEREQDMIEDGFLTKKQINEIEDRFFSTRPWAA